MTTPNYAPSDQPVFETDTFAIPYLASTQEGFEFQTGHVLGRTGAFAENEGLALSDAEKTQLKGAMIDELRFAKSSRVSEAREAWRQAEASGANPERVAELHQAFLNEREERHQKSKKIGFRALRLEGNTIIGDVQIVDFTVFNEFAHSGNTGEMEKWTAGGGNVMIVRTADNRILVQHRAVEQVNLDQPGRVRGNATFCDVPGASAGGWQDASLRGEGRRQPGTPDPIDTEGIKSSALKEVAEELGLDRDDLSKVHIVGIARDKVKPADVFLMLADSDMTAEELKRRSQDSALNKGNGSADFEEKFVDIDGSPAAIETLLTEVRCPIPPAHVANLLASGYYLILQEQGQEAAEAWKAGMHDKIVENYRGIDRMVSEFYDKFPEAYIQVPERYLGKGVPRRNAHSYTPAYTPEEQGLPSFEDEMVRVGLMPERRTRVDEAALFDIDAMLDAVKESGGALSERALTEIAGELIAGRPVGVNSAYSTDWLVEHVVKPLQGRVSQEVLKNFIAIGEDGGTWATFNEAGELYVGQSPTVKKPQGVEDKIREIVGQHPELLRIDESKQTMISVEVFGHPDNSTRRSQAQSFAKMELHDELSDIFAALGTERPFAITVSGPNIHITDRNVGKGFGANRFLELLNYRDIAADKVVVYADQALGLGSIDELERRQRPFELRQSSLALAA